MDSYIEEIVDCFQEFVQKSLLALGLGIASMLIVFIYMLRMISQRSLCAGGNCMQPNICGQSAATSATSKDEQLLRDVGYQKADCMQKSSSAFRRSKCTFKDIDESDIDYDCCTDNPLQKMQSTSCQLSMNKECAHTKASPISCCSECCQEDNNKNENQCGTKEY